MNHPQSIVLEPVRFEPPRLSSSGTGRISRATVGVGALNEAREEGRQQALSEMEHLVEHHRRARLDAEHAARVLSTAAMQFRTFDQELLEDLQEQVIALAMQLAETIIECEVRAFDDIAVAAAQRALSLVPDRGDVVLRVNPADRDAVARSLDGADQPHDLQIMADHGIDRGGCVAQIGPILVDAQISAAIARIREALGA